MANESVTTTVRSALPRGTARAAAAALLASGEVAGRRVVLAGSRVADAFRALLPLGSELRWQGATWLQVPHPSGLTQDYNRAEVPGKTLEHVRPRAATEAAAAGSAGAARPGGASAPGEAAYRRVEGLIARHQGA